MSQPTLELTPQQIQEANRAITDEKLNATQIQALVRAMDASKQRWARLRSHRSKYIEKLKQENEKLYFNYPGIFDLHAEDKLDGTFFQMLMLKRKIEKGEITKEEADAFVGQQMYQRYVPHVINNTAPPPPQMSYEDFYRQSQQ